MASDERLMKQGRLAEWENEAKVLAIKLHGSRQRLHAETDQFKPIDEMDVATIRVEFDDMCETDLKLMAIQKQIRELREDLGFKVGP